MKIAALARGETHLLLSQVGRNPDEEDSEFLHVVMGRVPAWCFCFFSEVRLKLSVADKIGGVEV